MIRPAVYKQQTTCAASIYRNETEEMMMIPGKKKGRKRMRIQTVLFTEVTHKKVNFLLLTFTVAVLILGLGDTTTFGFSSVLCKERETFM